MTIKEENRELNQLITDKILIKKYNNHIYKNTLIGNQIYLYTGNNTNPIIPVVNTIEKRLDIISNDARRAYFIEELLKSLNITINNIESDYDVIYSNDYSIIFCNKNNNIYTFIEFFNNKYDNCGNYLRLVILNLNNKDLMYDRIDLIELKHYHAKGEISQYTLDIINKSWSNKHLTENDLYDVIVKDAPYQENECAWNGMVNYGEFIGNLDINKLNKKICKVKTYNGKQSVYYL